MNESENNFESLRRLLALKRHEIPPPGYFNDFSNQVRVRIGAAGAREPFDLLDRLSVQAPWLAQWLGVFEMKPVYVGSFACSLCLLLLFGIVYAERPDATPKTPLLAAVTQSAGPLADATMPILPPSSEPAGLMVSTNPVLSLEPVASLFGQQKPLVQPASFSLPGN